MEQYIKKSALVAEIESRIKSMEECFNGKFPMSQSVKETEQDKGKLVAYKSILSFINTLEVKEMDLENELKKDWLFAYKTEVDCLECMFLTDDMFVCLAKKYFELGLKAQKGEEV